MREGNLSFEPNLLMAVQQKLNLSIGKVVILSKNLCFIMPKTWIINKQLVYSIVKVAQSCLTLCNPMDCISSVQFSSVAQSCLTLRPRGPQHTKPPCPSPTPRAYTNSCPLSQWCHPTISSSVVPFSSHLQSFPASGSFQMSQFFTLGGQSIEVSASASVLPMNIQNWFPLGLTGWISLQSKGLSRVFSNTIVQKHQFFGTQLSL